MTTGTLKIHSENILPIIKKWLYSDKDIFVRELVCNACDALQKIKILRDRGEAEALDEEFRIELKIDKTAKTLTISDTGIGMTAEEVEKYIAQLAFSGAEEFLQKYKSNEEKDQIIGHFGLGFYSAYMVASNVQINTLSYKTGSEPVLWTCDGSSEYEIDRGSRSTRGTEIVLSIAEGEEEYLDSARLGQILRQYCVFLPFSIYLDGAHINAKEPLWMKSPSECTESEYLEFYHQLYPMDDDPLFWIHLNVDYPFHLKGILYFPKIHRDFEFSKNTIKLFCNRVFVSDNCKDLIPEYLMVLKGAIDSPDIPLNVSRSYLQMDRTVRQLATHISKKVSDRLSILYKADRERFIQCWPDIEVIIKLGAMQDDKFYARVKEFLIWKNTKGEWTTLEEYLERNKTKHENKIFYTQEEHHQSHFLELYREQGVEVLYTHPMIDGHLVHFLERQLVPVKFQRIDGGIDEAILDAKREKSVLDAEGKTDAGKLSDFVRSKLEIEKLEVVSKSLASDSLPGFIMMDEQARRMRDYILRSNPEMLADGTLPLDEKRSFVVNSNSKLFAAIQALDSKDPELAKELTVEVYELALLSQREIDPKALNAFVARSNRVLEKLALRAIS